MERVVAFVRREPVRIYLYGVLVALLPVLVHYGILDPDAANLWLTVGGAVLVVGGVEVARQHVTPVSRPRGNHGESLVPAGSPADPGSP